MGISGNEIANKGKCCYGEVKSRSPSHPSNAAGTEWPLARQWGYAICLPWPRGSVIAGKPGCMRRSKAPELPEEGEELGSKLQGLVGPFAETAGKFLE